MNNLSDINEFLRDKKIAVAGVSRNPKKFGSVIFDELKKRNFEPVAVNPNLETYNGEKCYSSLNELPGEVSKIVFVTKPTAVLKQLEELKQKEKFRIWLLKGSYDKSVTDYCNSNGIKYNKDYCILLFLQPVRFPHNVHRFFSKLFGGFPK